MTTSAFEYEKCDKSLNKFFEISILLFVEPMFLISITFKSLIEFTSAINLDFAKYLKLSLIFKSLLIYTASSGKKSFKKLLNSFLSYFFEKSYIFNLFRYY